jgi:hypothetical protein
MSQDMWIFRIAFANRSGASHVRGAVPSPGINLFLRIVWRTAADFAKQVRGVVVWDEVRCRLMR